MSNGSSWLACGRQGRADEEPGVSDRIEHADALDFLARQERGSARVVCFDPPYSRGTPMRGREDSMAGSVYEPFGFLTMP